jgi:hypothetical protein
MPLRISLCLKIFSAVLAIGISNVFSSPKSADIQENLWPFEVRWENLDSSFERSNIAGPFWETRIMKSESLLTLRPFWLTREYEGPTSMERLDTFLYPLFTRRTYDGHEQWNIFSLIRSSEISTSTIFDPEEDTTPYYRKSFEVFPFYFDYDSYNPAYDYWAFFPFYGELKNRLLYNRIAFTLFPLYSEWERKDEKTYAYLWPFIRYRTGPYSKGLSVWPIAGYFERENDYKQRYALWPFLYYHQSKLYQDIPHTQLGILPFYARETKEGYIREDFLWPLFGYTLDQNTSYEEVRFLWPLFIQGRGTDRYINQLAPLYSFSHRNGKHSNWYLWPLLNNKKFTTDGVDVSKWKFLYFLYQDTTQTVAGNQDKFVATKKHLWPLYSYWKHQDGTQQLQILSILEPLFPNNETIRKLYSPLFSFYRYQELAPDHKDVDILFSLIHYERRTEHARFDIGPFFNYFESQETTKYELLKGLLGYERIDGRKYIRLLWFKINIGSADPKETKEES